MSFVDPSWSVVKQNQSKWEITFNTQVKTQSIVMTDADSKLGAGYTMVSQEQILFYKFNIHRYFTGTLSGFLLKCIKFTIINNILINKSSSLP